MKFLLPVLPESSMPILISLSLRKLAYSLGIAPSTVCRYSAEVLRMKYQHLRWVPHTLTPLQKAANVELAQEMFQELTKLEKIKFHFLFIGDELWMFYTYDHRTMWMISWDDVDTIERQLDCQEKTMLTIVLNGTSDYKIVILPKGRKDKRRKDE
jgi:hypothetical protein